jgi:uracil-DNA glycosylase
MPRIIFVGDRPSKKNIDPKVPFEGTRSHLTLLGWIAALGVTDYALVNSYNLANRIGICKYDEAGCHFVTLGLKASVVLDKMGLKYHRLPHPSPRNRLLNNPQFVELSLAKCKAYLDSFK